MPKSAGLSTDQPDTDKMKSRTTIGQIEQVVSSADCRLVERSSDHLQRVSEQNEWAGATGSPQPTKDQPDMALIDSMSGTLHIWTCFHIQRQRGRAVYKVLFPEATKEQVREYIQTKKLASRCCGSCLAWAVLP